MIFKIRNQKQTNVFLAFFLQFIILLNISAKSLPQDAIDNSLVYSDNYGFKANDPKYDNALVMNKFLKDKYSVLQFGAGTYYFLTKPDAITRTIKLVGVGSGENNTELRRDYLPKSRFEPFLYFRNGRGSVVRDLSIMATKGNSNGCALVLENHNGENVGYFQGDNLYISGYGSDNNWAIAVWLHGAFKTESPKGIRSVNLTGLRLFASTYSVLELNTVHNSHIQFSSYPAGGITNLTRISSQQNDWSNDITLISSSKIDLDISNAQDIVVISPVVMSQNIKNTRNIKLL